MEWCLFSIFWTSGQICTATSRLLVQDTIADTFYDRLRTRAQVRPPRWHLLSLCANGHSLKSCMCTSYFTSERALSNSISDIMLQEFGTS